MLKWAVGQKNPTPGQHISSCYTSTSAEGAEDSSSSCFRRATDRLHVARRRNSRGAVRKAAVRSLKRIKHDKENQPCLTPDSVSSRTRDRSSHIQIALRDVSNSPDPYSITPHRHNYIKRRQSHPLNLITKKSIGEHSKSAPTHTSEYFNSYNLSEPKPLPPINLPQTSKTSQKTPRNNSLNNSYAEVSDVVDMRKPNSTLKSLLTMQIEYSPGPLTATQSLVTLRKRLTKSLTLGAETTPQSIENPLYYALNASDKRANNGITISCNEQSPTLEGLLEEKSIFEQVSDKFEFINNIKKENSRIENTLVSSLSQRLEWLRLNNNFNNVSLLKERDGIVSSQDDQGKKEENDDDDGGDDDDDDDDERIDEWGNSRKRRDRDLLKRQKSFRRKIRRTNCEGACKTRNGCCCDKEKPKTLEKPKLMGLTLPLGIPSPITSEDSGLCSLGGLEGIHPLSSSPIENEDMATLTEEALSKYRNQDDESISTSLIVNKCSPSSICSSLRKRLNEDGYESNGSREIWSEEVVPLVKTPKLTNENRFKEESTLTTSFAIDDILPSPLALVEKRSRSRRCLRFVSPGSSTCQRHLSASRRPLSLSCPRLRDGREGAGELELSVAFNKDLNTITVHIGRGTDLHRPLGTGCNAYVKVALVPSSERTFFRTPVQRESSCPNFNERFSFRFKPEDLNKQILVSVWHRDRNNRKSEFLGCVSLAVKNAIKKDISGSFRLVAQSSGSRTSNQQRSVQCSPGPTASSIMARRSANPRLDEITLAEEEPHSSPEKHLKFGVQKKNTSDDFTFLQYLELEPLPGEPGKVALPEALAKGGRTPFTTTKQLIKQPGMGFGFSVAWTQPPRVERVEPGLAADRAGIRPGDFVVFVNRFNVVTMSEEQVLNIIEQSGNEMHLEIYRKSSPGYAVEPTSYAAPGPSGYNQQTRSSTACSAATSSSLDLIKKRLHLPQIAFKSEVSPALNPEETRKKAIYQLLNKEQSFAISLHFGINRFMVPLSERRDFMNPNEHHVLFQNIEELLRLTEETLEQVIQEDVDSAETFIGRLYFKRIPIVIPAYRRYCAGIKRADCLLAEKFRSTQFTRFCAEPSVPPRRPDLTTLLHLPLAHYREMFRLLQVILHWTKTSDDDQRALSKVVSDMQVSFKEVTAGFMEPDVEGRPLLSVQDLESRFVFTRCKPFVLDIPGRQWIFGGDLSRVEGRTARPFWTLLFTDIIVFAKVSRDRVLFITEEPLILMSVSQASFNIRKKANEFRLVLTNEGADSPDNAKCGPDIVLSRTPTKKTKSKCVALRAPTTELKAVWQNLIQRQIIYLNTRKGGTPVSSPLESPEQPATTVSVGTLDSASLRRQTAAQDLRNANIPLKPFPGDDRTSKRFNELIDLKCRQLSRMKTGKGGAIHLAEWMKDQWENPKHEVHFQSDSMSLIQDDFSRKLTRKNVISSYNKLENKYDEVDLTSDVSSTKATEGSYQSLNTSESQSTIKSNNPEKTVLSFCRKCHKTCLGAEGKHPFPENEDIMEEDNYCEDAWEPLMMMGMCGVLPTTAIKTTRDPFTPVEPPSISVLPPTPDRKPTNNNYETGQNSSNQSKCNSVSSFSNNFCDDSSKYETTDASSSLSSMSTQKKSLTKSTELVEAEDEDTLEASILSDELPYKTLPSPGLRRFGTMNSLERVSSEDALDQDDEGDETGESEKEEEEEEEEEEEDEDDKIEVKTHSPDVGDSVRNWTVRAGSFVAAKMAFFESISSPDNSMTVRKSTFLERYLKPSGENHLDSSPDHGTNTPSSGRGEDEGEISAATSGEEIWGTPTSGGDFEEELVGDSPTYPFMDSPRGSIETEDDSDNLMEDLLISLPMLAGRNHGIPPRRRLEPLPEEDPETISAPSSPKFVHEFKTVQGRGFTGSQEQPPDSCFKSEETAEAGQSSNRKETPTRSKIGAIDRALGIYSDEEDEILEDVTTSPSLLYRLGFRKNVSRECERKGNRLLGFLSSRKVEPNMSPRASATYGAKPLFRYLFNKEPDESIPTTLPTGFSSPRRSQKQWERRFWNQLKKRRSSTPPRTSTTTSTTTTAIEPR